jgi:hypothetical protein
MTLRFALSKVLQILTRLWGVDAPEPPARHESGEQLARAKVQRIYTRNGVRVSIPSKNYRDRG